MKRMIPTILIGIVWLLTPHLVRAETRSETCQSVSSLVQTGDILFIEIDNSVLKRVARASGGWTNHVGMIIGQNSAGDWLIAESKIPVSKTGSLCEFVDRTSVKKLAIRRHPDVTSGNHFELLRREAQARLGIAYDLKFNFDNKKQYCSKFVYEIYKAALGIEVGQIENLGILMDRMKSSPTYLEDLAFWTIYYGGEIPREQRIITPESQYRDPKLITVLDNSNMNF